MSAVMERVSVHGVRCGFKARTSHLLECRRGKYLSLTTAAVPTSQGRCDVEATMNTGGAGTEPSSASCGLHRPEVRPPQPQPNLLLLLQPPPQLSRKWAL